MAVMLNMTDSTVGLSFIMLSTSRYMSYNQAITLVIAFRSSLAR
jgi:hypothetical protein